MMMTMTMIMMIFYNDGGGGGGGGGDGNNNTPRRRFEPVPGVRVHPLAVHGLLGLAAFALLVAPLRWRPH